MLQCSHRTEVLSQYCADSLSTTCSDQRWQPTHPKRRLVLVDPDILSHSKKHMIIYKTLASPHPISALDIRRIYRAVKKIVNSTRNYDFSAPTNVQEYASNVTLNSCPAGAAAAIPT